MSLGLNSIINPDGNGRRGTFFKNRQLCSRGGKQCSKAGAKADAYGSGKGHTGGVGMLQTSLTYGKNLLECAVEASKVYVQTPVDTILTNQRNHNSERERERMMMQ